MSIRRRTVFASLALLAVASMASAQNYPNKPITLVVPYPAGAAVDRVGRALSLELQKRLGQPVVVENLGGASGTIGAKKVQRATPDGYTLLVGTVNDMLVAPVVLKAGYTSKDFTAITRLSHNTTALVAHPSFGANNVDELVALAKKHNGPLLAGASGVAMMQTIGGTLLAEAGGFSLDHVPYKGGAPLLNDLAGGQVQLGTVALMSALPMIREGRLKAIGVISSHRDPTAPNIPTVNEGQRVKGVEADLWTGVLGPAGLPEPVLARLTAALKDIATDAAYRDAEFKAGSIVVEPNDSKAFSQFLLREEARLKPTLVNVKAN
ncbi:Bug family tripartite tricarboxylate transporter substrate binding protein [Hydrogenophaga palleronii]|uniref:Bug family tripartite tricarboxylate transporter substrate binding protein n=1 Tax=Hydrogenophaga palleronii TaxID=65655 RepID=UPI000A04534C|nr:tripartite tricarboxylate transporter substrate binding protein [Hydrogenophaga palleronii]